MKVTHHGRTLEVRWSIYVESGEDALMLVTEDGEPYLTATVALWAPSPVAPEDHVWLRTWNECEGIPDALEAAGLVKMTGVFERTGYCVAVLGKLTPEAIAHRDANMPDGAKAAQATIRAKDAAAPAPRSRAVH